MTEITPISSATKRGGYTEQMETFKAKLIQDIEKGVLEPDDIADGLYYKDLEEIFFGWAMGNISADQAIAQINSERMLETRPEYPLTHAIETFIRNDSK